MRPSGCADAEREAEEELRKKTELNQILLDSLPPVAMLLRPHTREIVASNRAGEEVEAVPGNTCFETWGKSDKPCPWCLAPALWKTGKAQHLQPEGGGRVWDAHWVPVSEDLYLHYAYDITDQKRAEEALRESQKRQAEAEKLAATGRVAVRVAHEINNPLAGIKNSFLLIKDAVPKDHPDYDLVGRIEKEIDRIARIVHQMYRLHSPDKPTSSAIAVDETIRDVVLMLEPACRQYEVRIDVETEPADLTAAIPDGGFRQVLYNLLANAIEASPPEEAVKITTTLADNRIRVSVSDHGEGIPSEVQDRVFEPFFTTKMDTATRGVGLGLSIVKEIVDTLRGSIEFRSTPGKGTVFEMILPA